MRHGLKLKEIDHSSGHAFLSGGEIYYSPNCSRRVDVPEYSDHTPYPFHLRDARFEKFLLPVWWTRPYHYLSFVTLRPLFDGPVFGCLRDILPYIVLIGDKYSLAEEKISQWKDLEDALLMMAHLLNKHYGTQVRGAMRPILPSLLGFSKSFFDHCSARLRLAASRDWFLMWMALISSKMADIYSLSEPDEAKDWFAVLTDQNIPQAWLASVEASVVCSFSQKYPCIGTFLNIHKPHPNQPSVQWFVLIGIPVWYCWRQNDSGNDPLQPPAHILQSATTFFSKTPSQKAFIPPSSPSPRPCSPPPRPDQYSHDEFLKAQTDYLATKPWEPYFSAREERNKRIIAKESDVDRMTRLNREQKHPTVSCDVFLWDWSEDDGIELVRTRVPNKLREATLGEHSDSQSRYDAVSNVWDVCQYFGEPNNDYDDCDDHDYDYDYDVYPKSSGSESSFIDPDAAANEHKAILNERVGQLEKNHTQHYSVDVTRYSEQGPEANLEHAVGQVNLPQYLHHYYGFIHPLPVPANDTVPVDSREWGECLKSVGLDIKVNPCIPGLARPVINFIKGMQCSGPQASEWDLLPDNHNPLSTEVISGCVRKLQSGDFLLNSSCMRSDRPRDWHIALTTSANALYITRWLVNTVDIPSIEEVAEHLAEEGIPFRTYLKLDPLPAQISLSAVEITIPRRIANHKFTTSDYQMYISYRNQLLSTPRARAAILRGGIVGRLAKECLGVDAVLSGPSSAVTLYRLGHSVNHSNETYWDDAFNDDKLSVICGMFHCFTGNQDQIAKLSWWPLPEYWDHTSNLYNWGHWTEWDEHWYQEHLSNIQDGKVLPLTHTQWRTKLKSASSWRKVTKFNLEQSDKKILPTT